MKQDFISKVRTYDARPFRTLALIKLILKF